MIIRREGFWQALGVSGYCLLVGLFIANANSIVGNLGLPFGPFLLLLLFSTSVLICAAIVFYKPYRLFVEAKKKEALEIVISTAIWLFIFLLLFFAVVFVAK